MVFRPALWLTIATAVAMVILISLGSWQLQRLSWKNALVARTAARVETPATPLPPVVGWPKLDLAAYEYRPVSLSGVFDHKAEFHAFTSLGDPKGAYGGPGYWILTPLALADGGTVLINRGFVPADRKDAQSRHAGLIEGPVTVAGLFRVPIVPGMFVPEPDVAKNIWYARDVMAMATQAGIASAAPFYIDALGTAPGGLPQGGETRLVFINNHLDYALTWFGLAVALIAVYLAYHRSIGRLAWSPKSSERKTP